jgi:hypothetical protein
MKVPYTKCGKCGDTIFQGNRWGGQIQYRFRSPTNPRSYRQTAVRKLFTLVSISWSLLAEQERQAWDRKAKSQKSRRRLGKSWPLKGFYYYMRENVLRANRGQPLLSLPPVEPFQPRPELPLLVRTLSAQELQLLTASVQTSPQSPGPAPPASG